MLGRDGTDLISLLTKTSQLLKLVSGKREMDKELFFDFESGMFASCSVEISISVRQKMKLTNEEDLAYTFLVYLNSVVNLLFFGINYIHQQSHMLSQ